MLVPPAQDRRGERGDALDRGLSLRLGHLGAEHTEHPVERFDVGLGDLAAQSARETVEDRGHAAGPERPEQCVRCRITECRRASGLQTMAQRFQDPTRDAYCLSTFRSHGGTVGPGVEHPDAQCARLDARSGEIAARARGIPRNIQQQSRIAHRARDRGLGDQVEHRIDRVPGRPRGLEPDKSATRGRGTDRAPGIGAVRGRRHPRRHRGGRTATGPAREKCGIPRVPGDSPGHGIGGGHGTEFRTRRPAGEDQPRRPQTRHQRTIGRSRAGLRRERDIAVRPPGRGRPGCV